MKNNFRRSFSALPWVLCCTLGSGLVIVSCEGTETDNPIVNNGEVFDGTSPENFSPAPGGGPSCLPPDIEKQPMLPRWLARSVVVPSARGSLFASGANAGGLGLFDGSDPESPVELSRGVVQGEIHQLLVASSGELWVLATEPPAVESTQVPSTTALDPVLRLVRVDVSDPAHPVRLADATLEGDAWELRERNGEAWVLSGRRDDSQRGCAPEENYCGFRYYQAVLLHGFRTNGAALEPIGDVELPFEQRAWWGTDGLVTALADGTTHAVSWDGGGALRGVSTLPRAGRASVAGPTEVAGNELSVVRVVGGEARIDVYDLDAGAAAPQRTLPLGARTARAGVESLIVRGHLWLQAPYGQDGPNGPLDAELWDLTGAIPVRVALPQPFHTVLPIADASRAGQSDEILALGLTRDNSTAADGLTLLSIQGGTASIVDAPELDARNLDLDDGVLAPAGIRGAGDAPAWVLLRRGPGLPLGIEPAFATAPSNPTYTLSFVGVAAGERAPGEGVANDDVTGVALVAADDEARGAIVGLELSGAIPSQRIELSPQMRALAPTAHGVVTVAVTLASECEQTGADCSGYAPGVSVFDFSGEPRLVASLPFPELPLPFLDDPNRVWVYWELYDTLNQQELAALPFGKDRLAFVAQVYLTCENQADCDALEITAVPIAQANVAVGTPAPCPPSNVDPSCNAAPPPNPTVFGRGTRQYFYVLDVDAAGGPTFEAWGESRLAATAARTDGESRFAFPLATDGALAATRLERRRNASDVNDRGNTRFFLDRFERAATGEIVALPPVNVPGYPVARVGGNASIERWFSVEAAPGATGEGRLHRLNVQSDGARIEQSLELGGRFAGFRVLASGEAQLGLVLVTPDDGCGTSELRSIPLGSDATNASEPFAFASTLELPSDRWTLAATDGDLALLERDYVYVLVRASVDGTLSLVSTSAIGMTLDSEQLLGTSLFGAVERFGGQSFDLSPAP